MADPPKHPYAGDGIRDHKGHDRCQTCGLPRERDVHELPPTEDDVRAEVLDALRQRGGT